MEEDVLRCVGAEMLHDINTFRKRYCYLQAVDQVAKLVVVCVLFLSQGRHKRIEQRVIAA